MAQENVRPLPNLGPYAHEHENLPDPGEGKVLQAFPFDQKYLDDPYWYDTLGRSQVEQRKVFTANRPDLEQVEMVKQILDEFPTDDDGTGREWSVALEAAIKGSASVMQYLAQEKNLHVKNAPKGSEGLLAELHITSFYGFLDVVKVLVEEAGADVNILDEVDGDSALNRAAAGGHFEVAEWLLAQGARYAPSGDDNQIFLAAAESGSLEILKLLLKTAMEDQPGKPASTWIEGKVMGGAAKSGSVETLQLVLEQGGYGKASESSAQQLNDAADAIPMSIRNDSNDRTCLDIVIEYALARDDNGAFIRRNDEHFIDSLSTAVDNSCIRAKSDVLRAILNLILDATDITQSSQRFQDILTKAIHMCRDPKSEPCARELLEKWDVSPNVSYADDEQDVHSLPLAPTAISRNNVDWIKFWLDHGADIHQAHGPYCNGPTALALTVKLRYAEVARLLLDRGGPVDRMNDGLAGQKRLCVVVSGEEFNIVELTGVEDDESSERPVKSAKTERVNCVIEFEEGVTEEWLKGVQLRKTDSELARDGSGRPRKGRSRR